jgi:xylulokinase
MEEFILGVDVGTSGCKIVIVNNSGEIINSIMVPYKIETPCPGWAEQNPDEWFKAFVIGVRELISKSLISPKNIKAIGIDGMMNSPIFLDKDLKPIRPSILWLDQRSYKQVQSIIKLFKEYNILPSLPITPVVALSKILWLIENEQNNWMKTYKVLFPKDYIRFKLTGSLVTDPSDASATLLFDGKKYDWANYLNEIFKIDIDKLPEIRPSSEISGFITKEISAITGLSEGVPIVTGCSDGAADALSAGLINKFDTVVRLGTSGAIFMVYDEYKPDPDNYFILAHAIHNKWLIHRMFPFGIPHKWFFETFYKYEMEYARDRNIDRYEYIERSIDINDSENLIFIPNISSNSSYFDGLFIGIKNIHTKSHFSLALLEGLAFSLKETLEPIVKNFNSNINFVRLIGGGSRSLLLRKIISAVLKSTLIILARHEASLGAAINAGVGAKIFGNYEDAINKVVVIKDYIHLDQKLYEKYKKLYEKYRKISKLIANFTLRNKLN